LGQKVFFYGDNPYREGFSFWWSSLNLLCMPMQCVMVEALPHLPLSGWFKGVRDHVTDHMADHVMFQNLDIIFMKVAI
jgi:hypothetical protein